MQAFCGRGMSSWPLRTLVALAIWLLAAAAQAQTAHVVCVEEDWELVVTSPDPSTNAPQIVTAISPQGDGSGLYATFEINHRTMPGYQPGGLHLQVWRAPSAVDERDMPNTSVMATPDETIRWTQRMIIRDGVLCFEIINGQSTTWGQFGGEGYLHSHLATSLNNLDSYSPSVSVDNSGVVYAANRVGSLKLKRVRLTTSTGEVLTDNTVRTVHSVEP